MLEGFRKIMCFLPEEFQFERCYLFEGLNHIESDQLKKKVLTVSSKNTLKKSRIQNADYFEIKRREVYGSGFLNFWIIKRPCPFYSGT